MTAGTSWGSGQVGQASISPLLHGEALAGWDQVLKCPQPQVVSIGIVQGSTGVPQTHYGAAPTQAPRPPKSPLSLHVWAALADGVVPGPVNHPLYPLLFLHGSGHPTSPGSLLGPRHTFKHRWSVPAVYGTLFTFQHLAPCG